MNLEILLTGVSFYSYHGVFNQEKELGNEFIVDLSVTIPWGETEISDDLNKTVSYADLYEIVKEEMEIPSNLIETVATRIRNRIVSKYNVITEGSIKITKKRPPIPGFFGQTAVQLNFF